MKNEKEIPEHWTKRLIRHISADIIIAITSIGYHFLLILQMARSQRCN